MIRACLSVTAGDGTRVALPCRRQALLRARLSLPHPRRRLSPQTRRAGASASVVHPFTSKSRAPAPVHARLPRSTRLSAPPAALASLSSPAQASVSRPASPPSAASVVVPPVGASPGGSTPAPPKTSASMRTSPAQEAPGVSSPTVGIDNGPAPSTPSSPALDDVPRASRRQQGTAPWHACRGGNRTSLLLPSSPSTSL